MRNIKCMLPIMVLALVSLFSCEEYEGGENPEYASIELSDYSVTLTATDTYNVEIITQDTTLSMITSDAKIAAAQIVDSKIVISGLKAGRTLLSLKNDGNKRAKVEVIVTELQNVILEQETIDVHLGPNGEQASSTVAITAGNGEYTAISSKPEFASVEVTDDNTLNITGIAEGETGISVIDRLGQVATVLVNVIGPSYDLTVDVDPETPFVIEKGAPSVIINITSGNGDYQVETSNANIVTASLNNTQITLNSVKDGYGTVTLTDRKGRTIVFSIEVPFDLNDPTERIYWDGFRGDTESHPGSSGVFTWGGTKYYDWYTDGTKSNKITVQHGLTLLNPSDPKITVDKKIAALDALKIEKIDPAYTSGTPAINTVFWLTFEKDGKKGFIVTRKIN